MRFSEFKRSVDIALNEGQNGTNDRTRNLEMLLELISRINQSLNLDEVLKIVVANAIKLTDFEKGCVYLADSVTKKLDFKVGMDSENNEIPVESFSASQTVIEDVYNSGQSIYIENALNSADCRQCTSIISLELQTIFCAPLKNINGKIGVIYVDSKKLHDIREKGIIEIFEIMAGQATTSIINAELHSDLQKLSQIYTRNILTFMKGDRNRTAAFLGIPRKKLDALLD
ncbi:MAG: GAF domain-containing protein [Ignavibacteriaceae bacterium]